MSVEDDLADELEILMRNASDEVLALIADALSIVTEDTEYVETVISSRKFESKANRIISNARKRGDKAIDKAFDGLRDERESWAVPFFAAAGVAQASSKVKDRIISNGAESAKKTLKTLANGSVVGVMQGGRVVSTRTAYVSAVTDAVAAARSGREAYASSVQRTVRSLVNSGLREVPKVRYAKDYATGKPHMQELYSAVRRDVMAGFRETVMDYNDELGREFGADGWEVSAHSLCAEDHLQYQGEQYSKREMDIIQSGLARPLQIGANCHHNLSPVIVGVSSNVYSPQDIINMRRYSTDKVTITGLNGQQRTMSRYDASQYLRSLENTTRRYNTQKKLDKIAGVQSTAGKMERHTREVARKLCADTGLQYRPDRMRASV